MKKINKIFCIKKLKKKTKISNKIYNKILKFRKKIKKIIYRKIDKLLVMIGPCSITDASSSIEYAKRLSSLKDKYGDKLEIIMRVYLEKPRTTTGWKGVIIDPHMNDTFNVNKGILISRKILKKINELNIPVITEFLEPIISKYISDLITIGVIGARTTESPIYRSIASSFDFPVGFKNNNDGNTKVAIDAIITSKYSSILLLPDKNGTFYSYKTSGNNDCFLIMRGGKVPNFYKKDIDSICQSLKKLNLLNRVVIDCSHGNSKKNYTKQIEVVEYLCRIVKNNKNIIGIMLESNLISGKQNIKKNKKIIYGKSVTDGCLGWKDSKNLIKLIHKSL
ncbi:MAG: 3-deoxy-7-phosphoheptulonate synthase [Enterobacteriaceae bacterium]